jgi:hypothetical protein
VPVLFHTGGARGIRPAELSPLGRYPPRFRSRRTHIPFNHAGDPVADCDGPAQRAAVSGLLPFRESLATATGLARRPLVAPLGFTLLGPAGENLARALTRTPPTRFPAGAAFRLGAGGASEYQSALAWPHPVARRGGPPHGATLLGFSHRHVPEHLSELAVRAIGSPCIAPCITADSRRALDSLPRSTRAARETPEVPTGMEFQPEGATSSWSATRRALTVDSFF